MRNLKKVLSLALAMVMLLGMMVIGAGAVETQFADNDKVGETYKEAVAVMTEVGVLTGKENNNFDPEGTLTRAEAATILVRVTMGTEAAKGLAGVTKSGVFTDMSNHWAAGYVDACFNKGIVGGIGNSLYAPDSKLTGTQFAAMLMRAAGVEGDFTGSSWESAVIAAAAKAKLSEVTTGEISRQAAAKMALDGVLYSPSGEKAYKVGDLSFDNFLEAYIANGSKTEGITVSTASDSLAKTVLGLTETTKNDAFGNPQKVWQVDGKDKITVPGVKSDKTYTEKKSSLTDDLKGYSFKDAKQIVDGVETKITDSTDAAAVAKTIADLTGNGVEVNVYASNKVISKVVVVNPYVGEVSRVTEAKGDDKRSVTVGGLKFETEDFEKGDVVIYTKTKNDTETIRSMYLANVVEGVTVTRTTGSASFVADGETYKYAKLGAGDPGTPAVNNVIDVYLDQYGNAVRFDVNKGYSNYAYVADKRSVSGYGGTTWYAILVMTDGTVVEDAKIDSQPTVGDVVKFTKDAKDVYTLSEATNKNTGKVVISNGKAGMALSNGTTVNTYANNKTIFLVQNMTSKEWSAYTGYANVPSIEVASGDYTVVKNASNLATIVVVPNAPLSSNNSLFVLKVKTPTEVTDEDGHYFVYPAVMDGEITTVKLDGTIGVSGLYDTIVYANRDAEIIDISETKLNATTKVTGTVKTAFDEGIIVLETNTTKSVSADVEVYKLNETSIASSSIEEIKTGDTVTAIEKDGELVSVFYSAKGTGGSTGATYSVSVTGSTANMTYTITDGTTTKNNEALTGIASGANVTVNFTASAGYKFEDGTTYAKVVYTGINENKTVTAPVVTKGVADVNLKFELGSDILKVTVGTTDYGNGGILTGKKGTLLTATVTQKSGGTAPLTVVFRPDDMSGDVQIDDDNNEYFITLDRDGTLVVTTDSQKIAFDNAKKFVESRVFDVYYLVDGSVGKMQYYDNADYAWNNNAWSVPVLVTNWGWPEGEGDGKIHIQANEDTLKSALKSMMGEDLRSDKSGKDIRIENWGDVTVLRPDGVNDLRFAQTVTVNKYNDGTKGDEIGTITVTYKVHNASGTWDTDHFTETK